MTNWLEWILLILAIGVWSLFFKTIDTKKKYDEVWRSLEGVKNRTDGIEGNIHAIRVAVDPEYREYVEWKNQQDIEEHQRVRGQLDDSSETK